MRLGPLTTFYERGPEDAEDEANLERAWQEAGPLAASLSALLAALAGDERAGAFARRAGAETLAAEAEALLATVERAGAREAARAPNLRAVIRRRREAISARERWLAGPQAALARALDSPPGARRPLPARGRDDRDAPSWTRPARGST